MPDRLHTALLVILEEAAVIQNQIARLEAIAAAVAQLDHADRVALDAAVGPTLMSLLLEVEHRYGPAHRID